MKKRKIILLSLAVVLLIFMIVSATRTKVPEYETITAEKQNVVQKVSVTGKVKPAQALDLAFEQAGKVATVKVKVGDSVKSGDVLATLSSADILANRNRSGAAIASSRADVSQYQAALQNEQVRLEQLKNGTRSEELLVAELNVQKAQTALSDANNNLEITKQKAVSDLESIYADVPETLETAFTYANSAFLEEVADLFTRGNDFDRLSFFTKDSEMRNQIERERISLKTLMQDFQSDIFSLSGDSIDRDTALVDAKQDLANLRNFFNTLSLAVDQNAGLSVDTENLYRGYVNTAKTNINTALGLIVTQQQAISSQISQNKNTIQAAESSLNTAQNNLNIARQELILKQAGSRPEEISAQELKIKQAQANLASAQARLSQASADYQGVQANLNKTIIRAPISGIITKVDAKVGQFISSNSTAIGLISEADYEVEANIPEVDIAKIAPGKTADIRLDAYGDDSVFEAQVTTIDPAETIVEGVATYRVTLQFLQKDDRIKSGMTANTEILVERREDVVAVPIRTILFQDGKKRVKIVDQPQTVAKEIEVEVGLTGSDGNTEITKGLVGGEQIVVSEKKK